MTNVKCDNCDWSGSDTELDEIQDFFERVDMDGEHPTLIPQGECPQCGCCAYSEQGMVRLAIARVALDRVGLGWGVDQAEPREQAAIHLLRWARDLLKKSNHPRAVAKVRLAITSAEGAKRHAECRAVREG